MLDLGHDVRQRISRTVSVSPRMLWKRGRWISCWGTRSPIASPWDHSKAARYSPCKPSLTWAQRLKRVFNIDIETCRECGGAVKVIACIEDPAVIQKILTHLKEQAPIAKGACKKGFCTIVNIGGVQNRILIAMCRGQESKFSGRFSAGRATPLLCFCLASNHRLIVP